MKLCFDSIDEVKAFVGELRGTRGGRKGASGDDPGPDAPSFSPAPAFNPPATRAPSGFTAHSAPPAGAPAGFPAVGAAGAAPAIHSLAKAIIDRTDAALTTGQPVEPILNWFKTQLGPDAANATWDQMKTVHIPRLSEAQLKQIAPQFGVPVQ